MVSPPHLGSEKTRDCSTTVRKFLVPYFDLHDRHVPKDDRQLILCKYLKKKW